MKKSPFLLADVLAACDAFVVDWPLLTWFLLESCDQEMPNATDCFLFQF